MKQNRKQRGFTLIEVVLVILLLGIALPPLLHLFAEVIVSGAQSHALPTVTALAEELMEDIKSRKFDELGGRPDDTTGNWSTTLGPDAGETAMVDFDDVDDFDGWAQNFAPDFPNYTATVSVAYVDGGDITTPVAIPSPTPDDWTPSYKRIVVTLSNASLSGPVQVVTVVSEVQNL